MLIKQIKYILPLNNYRYFYDFDTSVGYGTTRKMIILFIEGEKRNRLDPL